MDYVLTFSIDADGAQPLQAADVTLHLRNELALHVIRGALDWVPHYAFSDALKATLHETPIEDAGHNAIITHPDAVWSILRNVAG